MTIVWFLVALGVLVTFHEFGHFYVARLCGVKVLRFSVGFGKPLVTWTDKLGTDYTLAPIPLGGYVKMLDEREAPVADHELASAFTQKSVWQRMAIVLAGPIANFILAIFFYFILAFSGISGVVPVIGEIEEGSLAAQAELKKNDEIVSVGGVLTPTWTSVFEQLSTHIGDTGTLEIGVRQFSGVSTNVGLVTSQTKTIAINRWLGDEDRPDLLAELGIKPLQPQTNWILTTVVAGGAAEESGLRQGDKLLSYDNQPVDKWSDWVSYVKSNPEKPIAVEFTRNDQLLSVSLVPRVITQGDKVIGQVGLGSSSVWPEGMVRDLDYSLLGSITYAFGKTWDQIVTIVSFLKKLLLLDVSTKNLGGAFTIAEVAGGTAAAGFTYYLGFLAFFSISLGVFNLLPIPVLDGGHFLFYVIEAIKGKPLDEKWQAVGYKIGLFFIVSMMVLAHYNDLVRLLS